MQKFQYVNEYNLNDMNILEQLYTATPHNIGLILVGILMSLLLGVGFTVLATNTLIIKKIESNTAYKIAIALIGVPVIMLSIELYFIHKDVHYIGHYEAEGQVVEHTNDNKRVDVKINGVEEPVSAKIPDEQQFKNSDKVLVKTTTRLFKERPPKEVSNFGLALNGMEIEVYKK